MNLWKTQPNLWTTQVWSNGPKKWTPWCDSQFQEGVDTGAGFRGNQGPGVWKWQKCEKMYFPHTLISWDKYTFSGIPNCHKKFPYIFEPFLKFLPSTHCHNQVPCPWHLPGWTGWLFLQVEGGQPGREVGGRPLACECCPALWLPSSPGQSAIWSLVNRLKPSSFCMVAA